MKKRLALILAAASALGALGTTVAHADGTVVGTGNQGVVIAVEGGGSEDYEFWVDGRSGNPGITAGYVAVHSDGDVFCSTANDSPNRPYNDNGTRNSGYDQPTEGANVHCN